MVNPTTYDPNTPTKQLPFSDWQIQFIQNFTQLSNAFSQNHVPLDDPTSANRGNHTYVEMPQQSQDPQTGSTEFSIFSKDVDGQTDQVFATFPGNSPVLQFTNYQIYSVLPTQRQTTYFTFLPGKLLVYFGTFITNGTGGIQANILVLNPPVSKNIVSVNLCINSNIPNYTPEVLTEPPDIPGFPIPPDNSGYVKSIFLSPVSPSNNVTVFYIVVANI